MNKAEPILMFDGHCNFCNGTVNRLLHLDKKGRIKFVSLQSEVGKKLLKEAGFDESVPDSLVFLEGGKGHIYFGAVRALCQYLSFPYRVLGVMLHLLPLFLMNPAYRYFAKNRYRWFGRSAQCRIPRAEERDRFLE